MRRRCVRLAARRAAARGASAAERVAGTRTDRRRRQGPAATSLEQPRRAPDRDGRLCAGRRPCVRGGSEGGVLAVHLCANVSRRC
eukprot:3695857-Prymnesium_polylepis.3